MTEHIRDGEGHFTLNLPPVFGIQDMISFTWDGDVNAPIIVAQGGYGEKIIAEFEMPMDIYNSLVQIAMDTGNTGTLAVVVMTAFETACLQWARNIAGGGSQ